MKTKNSTAPGETNIVSFMLDKQCEELALPVVFPKGRYEYSSGWQVAISAVKYLNSRLQHWSGRFSTNLEYNFFLYKIHNWTEESSINFALEKIHGKSVTASQLRAYQVYLFRGKYQEHHHTGKKFMRKVISCSSKTTWHSNLVYDIILCSFKLAWTVSDISRNTMQWSNW